jgi:hypothetical protein
VSISSDTQAAQHAPEVNRYHWDPAYVRIGYDPRHPLRARLNSNTAQNITDLEVEVNPYGYDVPAIGEPIINFWATPAYPNSGNSGMLSVPLSFLPLLLSKLATLLPLADGHWQESIDALTTTTDEG